MTTTTKTCIDCGAEFARSRADVTVRCTGCRRARRAATSAVADDVRTVGRMAARNAARKARAEHGRGSVEYREAVEHAIRVGAIDAAIGRREVEAAAA